LRYDSETIHHAFFDGISRGRAMKLHYYPETDSLYIELNSAPGTQTREIIAGINVDLDANGDVVGFDIDHASGKFDLPRIEIIALPQVSASD
jgi:uncharacterized protein YuzE